MASEGSDDVLPDPGAVLPEDSLQADVLGVQAANGFRSSQDEGLGPEEVEPCTSHNQLLPVEDDFSPERCAEEIIQLCLDGSNERVDLSYVFSLQDFYGLTQADDHAIRDLQLEHISDFTIRPLQHMVIPGPHRLEDSDQDVYEPLVPSLKLFLSQNLLRTLPSALFCLDRLTVLSLRKNNLTSIPSAIGKLVNLVELNVGGNKLRYLPCEVFELMIYGALVHLTTYPNPFVQMEGLREPGLTTKLLTETADLPNYMGLRASKAVPLSYRVPRYPMNVPGCLGITPVAYLNINGLRHSLSQGPVISNADGSVTNLLPVREGYAPVPPYENGKHLPSLTELCLRQCGTGPDVRQLNMALPEDFPENISRLLQQTEYVKGTGGQTCSICGKQYVIARTQWIEFWSFVTAGLREPRNDDIWITSAVPLLRHGCSWACVYDFTKLRVGRMSYWQQLSA